MLLFKKQQLNKTKSQMTLSSSLIRQPRELDIIPISATQNLRVLLEARSFWIDTKELYFLAGTYTKETIEKAVGKVCQEYELNYHISRVWGLENGINWEDLTLDFQHEKQLAYIYLVYPDRKPWENQDAIHVFYLDWVQTLEQNPQKLRQFIHQHCGENVLIRSVKIEDVKLPDECY